MNSNAAYCYAMAAVCKRKAELAYKAHQGTITAGELSILTDPITPLCDITGGKIDYLGTSKTLTDRCIYYTRKAKEEEAKDDPTKNF